MRETPVGSEVTLRYLLEGSGAQEWVFTPISENNGPQSWPREIVDGALGTKASYRHWVRGNGCVARTNDGGTETPCLPAGHGAGPLSWHLVQQFPQERFFLIELGDPRR
jgi:hypothetical protein